MGFMRRIGELAGDLFDMLARHAGDLLRPRRGIGFNLGEIFRRIDIIKPSVQAVVSQNQVIYADHQAAFATGQRQLFHRERMKGYRCLRHAAEMRVFIAAEVGEGD